MGGDGDRDGNAGPGGPEAHPAGDDDGRGRYWVHFSVQNRVHLTARRLGEARGPRDQVPRDDGDDDVRGDDENEDEDRAGFEVYALQPWAGNEDVAPPTEVWAAAAPSRSAVPLTRLVVPPDHSDSAYWFGEPTTLGLEDVLSEPANATGPTAAGG